jgi:peptide/nickel transport system ATP-binding protein
MTIILITHNLGVVAEMCDEVVVMYLGRVVEQGRVDAIFHAPRHPYTQALLRSIPSIHATVRTELPSIAGSIPHPYNRPAGCPFHPRCPDVMPGTCNRSEPNLHPVEDGQEVSCFLYHPPLPPPHLTQRMPGTRYPERVG